MRRSVSEFGCRRIFGAVLGVQIFVAVFGSTRWAQAQSVPVTVGYRDFNFGAAAASEPTFGKSESKLWWNDGLWWGVLWNPATERCEIYRFEVPTQNWTSTNSAADPRSTGRIDALWDGLHLYVASHSYTTNPEPTIPTSAGMLYRYSYNTASKQYILDTGFPLNVNNSKSETLTLDKDSTGKLWITWIEDRKVMINRTLGNDLTWGTPFALPVQGNDADRDDISALIAFGGNKIGVMWSNQRDSTNYFAVHLDGDADTAWQPREIAVSGVGIGPVASDHFNLKASRDGSGNLYAAALTNLSGGSKVTSIFVLRRSSSGVWTRSSFATQDLNHNRPMLALDDENQRLYVFARSTDTGPGIIYMKSASLSNLVFPVGLGTPIIQSTTDLDITNPSGSKHNVNHTTGILVLAADKGSRYYLHNHIDLVSRAPVVASFAPGSGPIGTQVTLTGKNFANTSDVMFNGTSAANFTIDSDMQLRATVPAGASSGKITVVNQFGAGSSATNYLLTAPPTIISFTPAHGPVGTQVTILGNNFNGVTAVAFSGTPQGGRMNFTVDSNNQIRANVPSGATTGIIRVTNADGSATSANIFTVTSTPSIFAFAPIRAVAGTQITIVGSNFSGTTAVSFNGKPATFTLDSDAQIRANVPFGATTGSISITNSAGTGISLLSFVVQHTLRISQLGSGTVEVSPPGGVYDENAVVTLTAVAAAGWEFDEWDGDLNGSAATTTLTMNVDRIVTAKFRTITPYTLTIKVVGAGSIALDPPGGLYYRDTVVKLTATPAKGYVFSGYSGDFKGWMSVDSLQMDADKNSTATFSPLPTPRYATGIWTSASEVSKLPMSGLSWENLKAGADKPIGPPNLSDKEDSANVAILAKALVYARTGDQAYRQAVIAACMAAIGTEAKGETLDLARELLAYVLAADLVGLPPTEETTFKNWLRGLLTKNLQGQTLRSSHETRPNNWGTHCGATRAAIARYLGDATELERTARVFKGWLGDRTTYADFSFDPNQLEWQADPNVPVGINPPRAMIQGHSVDGVLPDDQRRSGPFVWPPPKENYVYGALQGAFMQAVILYRAGYSVWHWKNQALLRAVQWLHDVADYPAAGDDQWLMHVVNHFYKTNFPAPFPARPGKNAGWTDWLYGSKYALTVSDNNGNVAIHALGTIRDSLAVMKLQAIPSANYLFNGWSGDLSGFKNPDTLVMNANKNVIANFMKAGPFAITVTAIGSGTVTMNPPSSEALPAGTYYGGTVVTLTAEPSPGFKFTGWNGDLSGTANPESLAVSANMNITATFIPVFRLTVNVIGSGSVTLDPPNGPYENGTVVRLTANPVTGYQFIEWSGDLSPQGGANPAMIIMDTDRNVTANFTRVRVVHEATKTGGASLSAIVNTAASFAAARNQLYLAAITTRPLARVNSVSGLGLAWKFVKAQCSGRNTIGVELWMAQGTSTTNGVVTATLASAPYNTVIAVSSYSGAAIKNAIGHVISGSSAGFDGACTSGVDTNAYSFELMTTMNGALVFGAVGTRNKTHTPGSGYVERVEHRQGINSSTAAIAIEDKIVPAVGTAVVNGTFSDPVDWAVIAVAIKPPVELPSEFFEDDDTTAKALLPTDYQLYQNYPNPFNAQTQIEYYLPAAAPVNLSIYNVYGQKVRTLIDELQVAGRQQVLWTGTDDLDQPVGSGVYLLRLEGGGQHVTRRILLVK